MAEQFDMLLVGHFARDLLVVDGKGEVARGGGIYYGAIAAKRLGRKVAVVTRLHPGDYPLLNDFETEGIPVYATPAEATSGIENRYRSADMERRICLPLGFAGPFRLQDFPDVQARLIAITPIIAGEVDLPLVQALAERAPVALDLQGFVRVRVGDELVYRPWPEMRIGLKSVTYLKADRAEAESTTGETDLGRAARALSAMGPREVLITETAGVTVLAEGQVHHAPFTSRTLAGRTGRGDTAFASYLAARLTLTPAEACALAARVTSEKQETPGPWRGSAVLA